MFQVSQQNLQHSRKRRLFSKRQVSPDQNAHLASSIRLCKTLRYWQQIGRMFQRGTLQQSSEVPVAHQTRRLTSCSMESESEFGSGWLNLNVRKAISHLDTIALLQLYLNVTNNNNTICFIAKKKMSNTANTSIE